MIIPFGEYLPDLPDFNNPGSTIAKNVIPAGDSYQSFPSQTVYSNALGARCIGAFSTKDADGNTVNFTADANKLYRMASAAYADVSKVGGYTTGTDENWFFTRHNNRLIATNYNDNIQTFTVNTSSNFSDLSVNAPRARYIATIGNFIVVGNTFDSIDGNVPNRVRWSGLDDPTAWTVSATTQADYQDLNVSNGWIRAVVSGEYGVIFQERAIVRMEYVGSPLVWRFSEVETGKGTMSPNSVVKAGNIIFYLGIDGFYAFDGNRSIPIGANKVDQTFFDEIDLGYLARVYGTADFDKQVIYWAYPATGNTSGRANKILCYNYAPNSKNRWTFIDGIDIELFYTSLSEGYTLDTLDTVSGSLDVLTTSLDSRVWTGENYILSGFNSDHKQINFTGPAMTATLETAEFQAFPGNRATITLVRPLVNGSSSTITVQAGTRNVQTSDVSYGATFSPNSTGDCPIRSNARYHRLRVNISGGFDQVQGIEVLKATKVGTR
jgi:hypothetical protein